MMIFHIKMLTKIVLRTFCQVECDKTIYFIGQSYI